MSTQDDLLTYGDPYKPPHFDLHTCRNSHGPLTIVDETPEARVSLKDDTRLGSLRIHHLGVAIAMTLFKAEMSPKMVMTMTYLALHQLHAIEITYASCWLMRLSFSLDPSYHGTRDRRDHINFAKREVFRTI
jgi:hypothetical protein